MRGRPMRCKWSLVDIPPVPILFAVVLQLLESIQFLPYVCNTLHSYSCQKGFQCFIPSKMLNKLNKLYLISLLIWLIDGKRIHLFREGQITVALQAKLWARYTFFFRSSVTRFLKFDPTTAQMQRGRVHTDPRLPALRMSLPQKTLPCLVELRRLWGGEDSDGN